MHLGINCNRTCAHNVGKQSFVREKVTQEDNTEIVLRLIVCEITNWAELTQDRVHFVKDNFHVYYERVCFDLCSCLPDKCEVTSHRIQLGQNFCFPSIIRLQQRILRPWLYSQNYWGMTCRKFHIEFDLSRVQDLTTHKANALLLNSRCKFCFA
jgi:hypothetical protein